MYTDILELVRDIRFSPSPDSPRLNDNEIHPLRVELAATETSIRDLHLQLARLEARREDIQKKLATIVYPVSSLPAEILCKIFAAAVSSSPLDELHTTLLKITAVCQQWRATAIADPNLWTTIQYTSARMCPDDLFKCFLARTRGLPLHVSFVEDDREDLSDTIMASSSQWKEANLSVLDSMDPFRKIVALEISLHLPWLEKLTIDTYHTRPPIQLFSQATRLRDLTVSYGGLVFDLGFPTHQIRTLVLLHPTPLSEMLALMPLMPALEDLSFGFISDQEDATTPAPILMSALSTLSLGSDREGTAENLLRKLLLPALRTLHLHELNEEDAESIVDCVARSSATIHSIFLHSTQYETAMLILRSESAEICSRVRKLGFEPYKMTVQEEKSFAEDLGNGEFLPELESFTLLIPRTSPSSIRIRPFVDGITARAWNALLEGRSEQLKLEEFTLDFGSREISREDVEDLQFLDGYVQVKMPQGFPAMKAWESEELEDDTEEI
ncbi:hypothetical protein C8F01DRAFT_375190 [Mycena amicta]|nr:hypothetical protein C8F01DRAFT_375190 [Mycena amicta]